MASNDNITSERNRLAALYMFGAAIGYSLMPLIIALSGGGDSPFFFNASMNAGLCIGLVVFLLSRYRAQLSNFVVLKKVARRALSWTFLLVISNNFGYAFFALSTRFIDISITTIIYEISPIFIILFTAWLFRREDRFRKNVRFVLLLMILGFGGVAFVVASQLDGFAFFQGESLSALGLGAIVAIMAAIVASLSAFGLRWGVDLSTELPAEVAEGHSSDSIELFCVLIGSLIANIVTIPLSVGAIIANEDVLSANILTIGIIAGILVNAVPTVLWRISNLMTSNLGVFAIAYLIPILALVWLFTFAQVSVMRIDYFIIGAAAIITANLLINFEAEVRFGFKSLIVALWACGFIVLLRDQVFLTGELLWTGTSYFEALALSATIFTLILSFRVARLVSRTTEEENRTFDLFQQLELLVRRGLICGDVREHMLRIDVSEQRPADLEGAYSKIREQISGARTNEISHEDDQILTNVESDLNKLVHSKQQGLVFAELIAIYIFAIITLIIALLSRPDVTGWTAFLVEMFATLFSAVIVFLVFNVHDLQRERIAKILSRNSTMGGYAVFFRNARNRAFEQWLSILVGIILAVVYAWLLGGKWL